MIMPQDAGSEARKAMCPIATQENCTAFNVSETFKKLLFFSVNLSHLLESFRIIYTYFDGTKRVGRIFLKPKRYEF